MRSCSELSLSGKKSPLKVKNGKKSRLSRSLLSMKVVITKYSNSLAISNGGRSEPVIFKNDLKSSTFFFIYAS